MNLKKIVEEQQFSEKDLSDILKLDQKQIFELKNNTLKLDNNQIYKICNTLNVSADYLLGLIDSNNYISNLNSHEINDLPKFSLKVIEDTKTKYTYYKYKLRIKLHDKLIIEKPITYNKFNYLKLKLNLEFKYDNRKSEFQCLLKLPMCFIQYKIDGKHIVAECQIFFNNEIQEVIKLSHPEYHLFKHLFKVEKIDFIEI